MHFNEFGAAGEKDVRIFLYRKLTECGMFLEKRITRLFKIVDYDFKEIIIILDAMLNVSAYIKVDFASIRDEKEKIIARLQHYRYDEKNKLTREFFDQAVRYIVLDLRQINDAINDIFIKSNKPKGMLYQFMEAGNGAYDSLLSIPNSILHPIESVQNVIKAICDPIDTAFKFKDLAHERPIYFVSSVLTSVITAKFIGSSISPSKLSTFEAAAKMTKVADVSTKTVKAFGDVKKHRDNKKFNYFKVACASRLQEFSSDYILKHLSDQAIWENAPKNNLYFPKNLVFEGGGPKGVVYIGALMALEAASILNLKNIERVGGTSAGAITALLIAVGYTTEEIHEHLNSLNLFDLLDDITMRDELFGVIDLKKGGVDIRELVHIYENGNHAAADRLSKSNGLFPGENLRKWLEDRVADKLELFTQEFKSRDAAKLATFEDLIRLQKKYENNESLPKVKALSVIGSNVSRLVPEPECFSFKNTPNALIVDAVRISLSIPLVFYPHQKFIRDGDGNRVVDTSGDYYIDGGCFKNYPADIFDNPLSMNKDLQNLRQYEKLDKPFNMEVLGFRIEADFELYEAFLQGPGQPSRGPRITPKEVSALSEKVKAIFPSLKLLPGITSLFNNLVVANDCLQLNKSLGLTAQQMAHDSEYKNWMRTIYISPGNVGILDFNLTEEQKHKLIKNGEIAANAFLERTTFSEVELPLSKSKILYSLFVIAMGSALVYTTLNVKVPLLLKPRI